MSNFIKGCLLTFLPLAALAQDVFVPADLEDWRQWVLQDKEYLDCPFYFNSRSNAQTAYLCAWPGQLDLEVDAAGGRFTQTWTVYAADHFLPLPGEISYWPDQVTVNGVG